MVDLLIEFVKAMWILFPAYAANAFPLLARGKLPIDMGKRWGDRNRILGDGKTIEGFLLGAFIGTLVGVLEAYLDPTLNLIALSNGFELPRMTLFIALMIAFGALAGDLGGSFIKRRLRMGRGKDAPLLDQLDFIIGVIIFAFWFTEITIYMIIIMLIITPIIHRLACIIGHWLKLKREPW